MEIIDISYNKSGAKGNTLLVNQFSTNVSLMQKPGSWFSLAKCLKNTYGRVTFEVKMQVLEPPPIIKGAGGRTFQKLSHLRGYEIFCQKGGINLKRGLMQKWVTFRIFSLFSQPCKITFLIHSGSVQKILTALFNLLWNTQKSKWTFFLCVTWRDVSQY